MFEVSVVRHWQIYTKVPDGQQTGGNVQCANGGKFFHSIAKQTNTFLSPSFRRIRTDRKDDLLRSDDSITRGFSLHRLFLGTKLSYDLHLSFYE